MSSVRQRNDTIMSWPFAATNDTEAHTVPPGVTADYPVLLDGWALADEPQPPAVAEPPKNRPKKTTDTDESKGGGPR
ncbi:hypothetical protein AB0G83_10240 [Streptomyces klenkii]|uniref:hypothetical protein n=1 Tax=Streptomyces klenkii TaxID=1420899 RepID=UPI0033DA8C84